MKSRDKTNRETKNILPQKQNKKTQTNKKQTNKKPPDSRKCNPIIRDFQSSVLA